MKADCSEGWAVGGYGEILHYQNKKWQKHTQLGWSCLNVLWMNADGTEGWTMGWDNQILHYQNKKWQNFTQRQFTSSLPRNALWMNSDCTEGWAMGERVEILHYKNKHWQKFTQNEIIPDNDQYALWMNPDCSEGWAVGWFNLILHYQNNQWKVHKYTQKDFPSYRSLYGLWMNIEGTDGWAVGDRGEILQYQNGQWQIYSQKDTITNNTRYGLQMNIDGTEGWAVGGEEKGEILHYKNKKWQIYTQKDLIPYNPLHAIWMNIDCKEGWAVGDKGEILHFNMKITEAFLKYTDKKYLSSLEGDYKLITNEQLLDLPVIKLASSNSYHQFKPEEYSLNKINDTAFQFTFRQNKIRRILEDFKSKKCYIEFDLTFKHSNPTITSTFKSNSFFIISPPWFYKYTYVIIIIISLSILMFIFIIRRFKAKVEHNKTPHWQNLINSGENNSLEYKSTLRIDLKTGKPEKYIENIILKTIAAFLNSEGGILIIGVSDTKEILGLETDFNSFTNKLDKLDEFRKHFDNLIDKRLGNQYYNYLKVDFPQIESKIICAITVKSKSAKPIYSKDEKGKETFYIRRFASTIELKLSEIVEYTKEHWKD